MSAFENLEYPVIYTYKMVGEDSEEFRTQAKNCFAMKEIHNESEKGSSSGKYVSISITVEVSNYNEMQTIYGRIKDIKGLKYHL